MARSLARAVRRREPTLDPGPWLGDVSGPVHLLHGRHDRLIPFSEMLRLAEALPRGSVARCTVTRLFGHSARHALPGWGESAREAVEFVKALSGLLTLV